MTVEQVATRGGTFLPRAEVRLTDVAGRAVTAHVYEAYWAPLPEGKVRLWDVITFLFAAGQRGVRFALREGFFDRWMFGGRQEFEIPARRVMQLILAAWVVALLAVAFVGHAVLALAVAGAVVRASWPGPDVLTGVAAADLAVNVALVLAAGAGWALSRVIARGAASAAGRGGPRTGHGAAVGWHASPRAERAAWLAATFGILVAAASTSAAVGVAAFAWGRGAVPNAAPGAALVTARGAALVLLQLAVGAGLLRLRRVLIDYVGDVVTYVSPYEVNRFQEVRNAIQRRGREVARLIYGAGQGEDASGVDASGVGPSGAGSADGAADGPSVGRYDEVLVVGHSLGSVLAYDTLNDAINRDRHAHGWFPDSPVGCFDVVARTRLLFTFGSPLDKTAFVFRIQGDRRRFDVREALAAAVQPLIAVADYGARPARWINVWSRWDWVSGALHYYDAPARARTPAEEAKAVLNVEARTSRLPWRAHTGYWRQPLVRGVLYAALTGRVPADVDADAVEGGDDGQVRALWASLLGGGAGGGGEGGAAVGPRRSWAAPDGRGRQLVESSNPPSNPPSSAA